jgi:hypothetical protein
MRQVVGLLLLIFVAYALFKLNASVSGWVPAVLIATLIGAIALIGTLLLVS